jgi:large conductance mechanosensitive channel
MFINTVIDFLIMAFIIFLVAQKANKLHPPRTAAPPTTKECQYCLSTIPVKATRCAYCTAELRAA